MDKCYVCESTRLLQGSSFGESDKYTCQDCGSVFGETVRVVPEQKEIQSQIKDSMPFPAGGFDSLEQAQEHLKKLQEAAKKLGKPVDEKVDRPSKKKVVKEIPNAKLELKDDYPKDRVFQVIHTYQREGEGWQSVLNTCKSDREYKFENVRIFAHNHNFGLACTPTCREI